MSNGSVGVDEDQSSSAQVTRRELLAGAAATTAAMMLGVPAPARAEARTSEGSRWRVAADDIPHVRTWMAWPSSTVIWGRQLAGVQRDIALLAATIAHYEPVRMCANGPRAAEVARASCGPTVAVIDSIPVDDCWMRDSGPVFRVDGAGGRDAFGLNFNAWGGKQPHRRDRRVARRVTASAGVAEFARATVVGEGGGIECDGAGTLMATRSCWLNPNRNPDATKDEVSSELRDRYGATRMIWLPGVRGRDITDGHVDSTARFVSPGVVMVQLPPPERTDRWARNARRQHEVLSDATDAQGRRLEVLTLEGPDVLPRWPTSRWGTFLDSYVNWVLTEEAIITVQFGDTKKDAAAKAAIEAAFPERAVVQLDLDRLHGNGGGGAHCVTMHEPQG